MQLAIGNDSGAYGNRGIHVAVPADVANSPGINAAALGLKLADDLHGPDLGRTRYRARRKGGAQHINGIQIVCYFAGNV